MMPAKNNFNLHNDGMFPFHAGPIIEEGLIIGFSILALLIIVSIVLSILEWTTGMVSDFFNIG